MKKYRALWIIALISVGLSLAYEDPNETLGMPQGRAWGKDQPLTSGARAKLEKGQSPESHNLGYNLPKSSSYGTYEIISEKKVGYKTYVDVKWKHRPSEEVDLTDPYLQDLFEDEMGK
jgi:hypothetical protein